MIDLISRQAAIDAMNAHLEDVKRTWGRKVKKGEIAMCLDLRGVIEALPSVQPERKKGKWINIKPLLTAVRCSECKRAFAEKTNFCPHCGVEMEEIK